MLCPFCKFDTSVEISRPSVKKAEVWRRRHCKKCSLSFSSREKPELTLSVKVLTDNNDVEAFSEDKLLMSIYECLSHRNDALKASRGLTDTIIARLFPVKSRQIKKSAIAEVAYQVIYRFDRPAAVFYKSHHQVR